jgi:hypothetical protein
MYRKISRISVIIDLHEIQWLLLLVLLLVSSEGFVYIHDACTIVSCVSSLSTLDAKIQYAHQDGSKPSNTTIVLKRPLRRQRGHVATRETRNHIYLGLYYHYKFWEDY